MFVVRNLSVVFLQDGRKLIDNLSFSLESGDKVAIIGEEGNGKSTIAKAIACPHQISSYAAITGQISTGDSVVGYLEQILDVGWYDQDVTQYFLKDDPFDEADYERYERFGEIDKIAKSLGLKADFLDAPQLIGQLSGGEKVKMQLVKILMSNPDILILDEPTNDLDIATLEWLENFILNFNKPIVFISHDEELLEKTANAIIHVEQLKKKTQNKCTFVHMRYRDYVNKRLGDIEKQTQVALHERAQDAAQMERWRQIYNRVDHELNTITRQDPHGARLLKKKMQAVKSQEKRFERERKEFTEIPDTEESITLNFGEGYIPKGKVVCDLDIPVLEIAGHQLSQNLKLNIVGPERVVIIGKNGTGKTTFIRQLAAEMLGRTDIKVGYMPQSYEELLFGYEKVLDYVCETAFDKDEITKIRTYLACLKFTHEEVLGNIDELSGGQKAKLFLAKLMASDVDVLILDEPTRNLSPLSNPVIREALSDFGGAIISVSHDRKFIKEVATRVLELTETGFVDETGKFVGRNEEKEI